MSAQIIDFQTARAANDTARTAAVENKERVTCAMRPYASMDDLPNVTPHGQYLIALYVMTGGLRQFG